MLPQPKTGWKCECGSEFFRILLCPDCITTENSHVFGYECVGCQVIHMAPTGGTLWEENENEVH